MALTSIDIPADLLSEVQQLTGQKTKRGAVIVSLEAMVRRRRQQQAIAALTSFDHLTELDNPAVRAKARG
jgi:Arc/MetJ family transcription regulator